MLYVLLDLLSTAIVYPGFISICYYLRIFSVTLLASITISSVLLRYRNLKGVYFKNLKGFDANELTRQVQELQRLETALLSFGKAEKNRRRTLRRQRERVQQQLHDIQSVDVSDPVLPVAGAAGCGEVTSYSIQREIIFGKEDENGVSIYGQEQANVSVAQDLFVRRHHELKSESSNGRSGMKIGGIWSLLIS